jgi:hypothetical protein
MPGPKPPQAEKQKNPMLYFADVPLEPYRSIDHGFEYVKYDLA